MNINDIAMILECDRNGIYNLHPNYNNDKSESRAFVIDVLKSANINLRYDTFSNDNLYYYTIGLIKGITLSSF